MKLQMKTMALLVAVALVGIFCYQAWWLVKLYQREMAETRRMIEDAVDMADNQETNLRVEMLRSDNRLHGEISASASPYVDTAYVESRTLKDTGRSMQFELRRRQVKHDRRDTLSSGKAASTTTRPNANAAAGLARMEEMVKVLHRSIRSGVNLFMSPSAQRFDSLFTARLSESGLWLPHLLEVIDDHGVVTDSILSGDFVVSAHDDHYFYPLDNDTKAAYRLTYHPVHSIVLHQMAGILLASAAILLVLCAAFWYLIRTILRQKTLDEMKSDFTNNITHELKTPIAVAYAANDALLNFEDASEKTKAYLRISQEQLKQLSGMVEQILSMSMERRKTLVVHLEDVVVAPLMEQLMQLHRLKADKPVVFSLDIEPQTLCIQADRSHLSNMVSNLLDNAIKYSKDEAFVTIRCRKGLIEVTDKGIGIPEAALGHIFEKFYRVPQGNRHDVKGYGLGLYYVKCMMEKHGGRVEAESTEQGTTIRLIWNA